MAHVFVFVPSLLQYIVYTNNTRIAYNKYIHKKQTNKLHNQMRYIQFNIIICIGWAAGTRTCVIPVKYMECFCCIGLMVDVGLGYGHMEWLLVCICVLCYVAAFIIRVKYAMDGNGWQWPSSSAPLCLCSY